ncbi:hypothetical protein GCM10012275_64640 [Longimycelium tulufanense]|uniref:Uncharacterized protein n=1 Tax=Longimycelium tulufanense TaxID=907463 RepID=A0A8J3FXB7_9PSEU|nr:hypothetical protein [Longimycelium tulufanense]GGM84950.1 hypothetical protein GCM10012275_64640 [Longimycelium tulufanense]
MSKMWDAIRRVTKARDWKDSVKAIRGTHGKRATRWLAEQAGVSRETARRWLKGTQSPRSTRVDMVTGLAPNAWLDAEALADAQALACGHVDVEYNGKPAGTRNIGTLHVDTELRRELDGVVDLLRRGDQAGAEEALSAAILGAYAAQRARDGRDLLRGTLTISNFRTGFNII